MKRLKRINFLKSRRFEFWRFNFVIFLIFLFGVVILSRLIYLQILQGPTYKALAKGQQEIFKPVLGVRGKILLHDRNNLVLLAANKDYKFCYLSPKEVKNSEEAAKKLSEILGLPYDFILGKAKNKESLFVVVKHRLTEEEVQRLKAINLSGVYLGNETLREYPLGSLAANVVGFLGGDGKGQYGVEGYWERTLAGKEGYLFSKNESHLPKEGSDLILTIDYNIQYQAEKLLEEAHKNLNIEGGQIIVMDPQTGKVIAMSSFPNFDPNKYREYAQENNFNVFQNGVIQKLFEPGSVFKPFTMAVALGQGKITPHTTYTDKGFVKIGGYTIYNYGMRKWGKRTMTEVLEKSINTGAVFAESQVSHNVFLNSIQRFGFFKKTGIGLQGEVFSNNEELKKGYEINFATASFGQGIEMTPINLARAFCAIANGGKLIKPYVVEEIKKDDGKAVEIKPEIINGSVISKKVASQLTAMLVSVVENGFAKRAQIPGYYVAGKTGTAQIPFSALNIDRRGYSNETWQSFIGFAPAFNPRFLILVKLDNPKTKAAGYSAVPIFQKLAKYIIDYWQIPPDYE